MRFKYAEDTSVANRHDRFVPCHRIPIDFDAKSINQPTSTPFIHQPFTNARTHFCRHHTYPTGLFR